MNSSPIKLKQKLSPTARRVKIARSKSSPVVRQDLKPQAAADKAARDLAMANSPAREAKRAHSQREKRAAVKAGTYVKGKDFDHKRGRFVSVASNRGNEGKGTKKEGNNNYSTT